MRSRHLVAGLAVAGTALAGLAGTGPAGATGPESSGEPDFTLTIFHNNDGESSLLPSTFTDDDDQPITGEFGGAARFVSKVRSEQHESYFRRDPGESLRRAQILLNSGDNILAGLTFEASRNSDRNFDAELIGLLGYDALAIGNHEFDFGPEAFADLVAGVQSIRGLAPFVSANLDFSGEPSLAPFVGEELVASTVVRERGRDIGVIGLTTTALRSISSPQGVEVLQDLAGIAQAEVDRLTGEGVDIIILQSHLQGLQSELELVEQLSGVDVVIGGGGDEILADESTQLLPGTDPAPISEGGDVFGTYPQLATAADGSQVPVVTTPGNYFYVGALEVTFNSHGEVIRIDEDDSGIKLVTDVGDEAVAPDPFVEQLIEDPVQAFVADLEATQIGTSEVAWDCQRTEVRGEETNCANLIADAHLATGVAQAAALGLDEPQLALQNGGGVRGEIDQDAGPITVADTFRVQPFGNFVSIIEDVPAEAVRQIIEEGAIRLPEPGDGGFTHVSGGTTLVIDTSFPARVADQDSGVQTTPGERVRELVLADGTVVVTDGVTQDVTVDLVQLNFSARGGDAQPDLTEIPGATFTQTPITDQSSLQTYIEDDLGGLVSAAAYPQGGEGRITIDPTS